MSEKITKINTSTIETIKESLKPILKRCLVKVHYRRNLSAEQTALSKRTEKIEKETIGYYIIGKQLHETEYYEFKKSIEPSWTPDPTYCREFDEEECPILYESKFGANIRLNNIRVGKDVPLGTVVTKPTVTYYINGIPTTKSEVYDVEKGHMQPSKCAMALEKKDPSDPQAHRDFTDLGCDKILSIQEFWFGAPLMIKTDAPAGTKIDTTTPTPICFEEPTIIDIGEFDLSSYKHSDGETESKGAGFGGVLGGWSSTKTETASELEKTYTLTESEMDMFRRLVASATAILEKYGK